MDWCVTLSNRSIYGDAMAKMGLHANEHADAGNVANGPAGPVLPAPGVANAKAIWTAAQQPGMPFVAPKDESQQCVLSLHAIRRLRVKMRTMLVNQLRGTLLEFGVHFRCELRAGL